MFAELVTQGRHRGGIAAGDYGSGVHRIRNLCKRNRVLEQEDEVLRRAAAYLSKANLPGKGSTRS